MATTVVLASGCKSCSHGTSSGSS